MTNELQPGVDENKLGRIPLLASDTEAELQSPTPSEITYISSSGPLGSEDVSSIPSKSMDGLSSRWGQSINCISHTLISPGPSWFISKGTARDEYVEFPWTVSVRLPALEVFRTPATGSDFEALRQYVKGESWLPPRWSIKKVCYHWQLPCEGDTEIDATLTIESLVLLEEINECIDKGNLMVPDWFDTWRKSADAQKWRNSL
ncbi:hypothetical protein F5883DRAFT_663834 [Diaporthe sp. PMI_573]|nr:hypothetical protein F5883DRAFT_663834 [Diaporthaceae sp. PMI_573]